MKCMECGADIYDGVKKCPYCKSLTESAGENEKFKDFDFKYTITSPEQMEKIRETVRSTSKAKKKGEGLRTKIEKFFAKRRAAKRAAKRAVRRGEDPKLAVQKLEAKEETNPFLKDTAVAETEDDALNTYTRVKPSADDAEKAEEKKVNERKRSRSKRSSSKKAKSGSAGKKPLIGLTIVLAIVALIVYLIVLLCGWLFGDDVVGSYSYVKDNTLHMTYKGESMTLTKNVLSEDYIRKLSEAENPPSIDSIVKAENLIHTSKNGEVTYFFENYDPDIDSGRLRVVIGGDLDDAVTVSEAVHNSFVMNEEGDRILYLRALEVEAQTGVLHFWEEGMEEPIKIVADIDPNSYQFSKDAEWALFLQNYRRNEKSGDLYAISLEDPESGKKKVDSDVYELFGSDGDGKYHVYGKEYDPANATFDVYAVDSDGKPIRLGEKTMKRPWVQKKEGNVLVLGIDDDGNNSTHNLYSVEISTGKKNKIDSGVSAVCVLSEDEETVIYEKVYNSEVSDYYAYREGELPSKVAPNIIVDFDIVGTNRQFAATSDCEEFLYISKFNKLKEGGTLIHCVYDGEIVSEKIIAEDVRSCYSTDDDVFVFTKNYSSAQNCFDVYVFEDGKERLLKEEVTPERFGVDKTTRNIYYVSDFNVEGNFGKLVRMNLDGESQELTDKVYGFVISDKGDVLVKKNFNSGKNTFDLYLIEEGDDEVLELNTSVSEILQP